MLGAPLVFAAGAVNFFYENTTAAGVFELSPLGAVGVELTTLTTSLPTRGIPYVPIAIMTELAHGMGLGYFYQGQAWDTFALTPAESRTLACA